MKVTETLLRNFYRGIINQEAKTSRAYRAVISFFVWKTCFSIRINLNLTI